MTVGLSESKPAYRILDSVEKFVNNAWENESKGMDDIQRVVQKSLEYYPELSDRTITVGVTHEDISYHGEPHAMADPYNSIIYINSESAVEYQTIFHELAHLVIHDEVNNQGIDHPITSEEYCSIYAVSRMPEGLCGYRKDIAYLGEPNVAAANWPNICERALEYRKNNRNYIQKCKEWLKI